MFQCLNRYAAVNPGNLASESTADEISTHSDSTDEVIEIKGDQLGLLSNCKVNLSVVDLWALGLTTAIGGHFYLWGACLVAGFGSFLLATLIISAAYGCLILCMAELSGALPFAGGAYGVTRVTMGSYPGFLVAWCDAYQSMFYTMLSVLVLGYLITYISEIDTNWQPVWWLIIYASYIGMHAWGGPIYWKVMSALSVGSMLILIMYILGCIKYADFDEHAPVYEKNAAGEIKEVWFIGGVSMFLKILPIPCWFYLGMESLNLAAHDTVDPKRSVPRAYLCSYATILVLTIATIFVGVSVFPGSTFLMYSLIPQSFAFTRMFDINFQRASALALPAIYTSGFGFTYYYSSQVRAMGKSGLAPAWLGYDIPYRHTPVPALLFGAVMGFLIGLRYFFWKALRHESLFSVSLQGAVVVYCSQFISFIMFRLYYPTIKREFVSPLGIPGAVFGIAIFLLVFISIAGLHASPGIIAFAGFIGVLTIYYCLVVVRHQTFSDEEKTVLFKAYLMKSNRTRAARVRTGKSHGFHAVHSYAMGIFGRTAAQETRKKPSPRPLLDPTKGARSSKDRSESVASGTVRLYGGSSAPVGCNASSGSEKGGYSRGIQLIATDFPHHQSGRGGSTFAAAGGAGGGGGPAASVPLGNRSSDKTETTLSVRYRINIDHSPLGGLGNELTEQNAAAGRETGAARRKEEQEQEDGVELFTTATTGTATAMATADVDIESAGGITTGMMTEGSTAGAAAGGDSTGIAVRGDREYVEPDVQLRDMHMYRPEDLYEDPEIGPELKLRHGRDDCNSNGSSGKNLRNLKAEEHV